MLHWLSSDEEGLIRNTGGDQNSSDEAEPFSGKAIETFEQSPTKSVSSWKNGKKHGETIEFFYNGRKRRVINYSEGIRDGNSKEYRITGELLREENYKDGKLDGPKSEWHPNGQKIMEVIMKEGVPHGESQEWYLDGNQKSTTIYRHGLREGPATEWYSSGQRKLGLFYQKDKQHGLRTIWYENGQQRLIAQFNEDKMEGNSKGWFPDGQQQFEYNFRNNQEHGICTEWNQKGEKVSELRFVDGAPVQDLLTGKRINPSTQSETPVGNLPVPPPTPIEATKAQNLQPKEREEAIIESLDVEALGQATELSEPPTASAEMEMTPPPIPPAEVKSSEIQDQLPSTGSTKELNPFASPPLPPLQEAPPPPPPPPSFVPPPPPMLPEITTPEVKQSGVNIPESTKPELEFNPFDSIPSGGPEKITPLPEEFPTPDSQTEKKNQFDPFESAPLPSLPDVKNEKMNSTKANPFDFEVIPQPIENTPIDSKKNPFDKLEMNSSAIPLGDVFNSKPASPKEEINPFDLPLPGQ